MEGMERAEWIRNLIEQEMEHFQRRANMNIEISKEYRESIPCVSIFGARPGNIAQYHAV